MSTEANASTAADVRRTPFSDEELQEFADIIEAKRETALAEVDDMRAQINDQREHESDSAYSFHMADAGTDAMELEKLYLMIARQQKYIGYLDRALDRIENKTYGICRVTGEPIAKERLLAVPHTEISVAAKKKEQKRR
ncbi:MAG: molecular chaperone DnaK [Rhodothermaceae bacterium]|nr:molecular chaperone DnaK [Rhodothermaceae bacterium]